MNYYIDYLDMKESNYIDSKYYDSLSSSRIKERVSALQKNFNEFNSNDKGEGVVFFLKLMSELAIYKQALELKMMINKLRDPRDPNKKYIQIRGSIKVAKNRRLWVGHYLGTEEKVCDSLGNVLPDKFSEGREAVIHKIVDKFVKQYLG